MEFRVERGWRSLHFHTALLACLLIGLLPVIGCNALFQVDEGAALAQVTQLREHGSWFMANDFPEADPDGLAFALDRSVHTDRGFAPLLKHPAYPLMLAGADAVGGRFAIALLGVLGTLAAAVAAALIGREIRPGTERWCLWIAGVSSPLLFDSYLVIAHTVGAAGFGFAVLGALRYLRRGRTVDVVVCAAGIGWTVLLRGEGTLAGLALGLSLMGVSLRASGAADRLRPRSRMVGAVTLATTLVFFLADHAATRLLAPGVLPSTSSGLGEYTWVGGRISAFVVTYLMPGYSTNAYQMTGAVIVVVFGAFVGWLMRVRRTDRGIWVISSVILWGAAILWVVWAGQVVIPGILPAFPLLIVAIVAWRRPRRTEFMVRVLAGSVVVFAAFVLATQYAVGGGAEWGARYLAIALPLVVPLIVWTIAVSLRRLESSIASLAVVALIPLALAPAIVSVVSLRASHAEYDKRMDQIVRQMRTTDAGDGGGPIVVSSVIPLPRFAWDHIDEGRWLAADGDRLDRLLERFEDLGVERFVYIAFAHATELGDGFAVRGCERLGSKSSSWRMCVATRTDGS